MINKIERESIKKNLQLANELRNRGEINKALEHYKIVLEIDANNFYAQLYLAKLYETKGELDKVISHYQKLIETKPDNDRLYLQLAEVLKRRDKIISAVHVYCQGIEINPEQPTTFYTKLLDDLTLDQVNTVIKTCKKKLNKQPNKLAYNYVLAISQAHKGNIAAAIATYKKIVSKNLTQASTFRTSLGLILKKNPKVYQHIWNELNQSNLNNIDEAQLCYPDNMRWGAATKYFTNQSKYRVIKLSALTEEDKLLLDNNNISLPNLKLMSNDSYKKQAQYLESLSPQTKQESQQYKKNQESSKSSRYRRDRLIFQESMLETGYIYTVCPISGVTLKSNQSFLIGTQIGIYRFVGEKVFYLVASGVDFRKYFIYLPSLELIIQIGNGYPEPVEIVNRWKGFAVANWQEIIENLRCKKNRKESFVVLGGFVRFISHHMLNDLAGIQRFYPNGIKTLQQADKFLVGPYEYFGKIDEIFPDIPSDRVLRITEKEYSKIPQEVLKNNYLALKLGDNFVLEDLAERMYNYSLGKCTEPFLSEVAKAKHNFPLLWITIRAGSRAWISQVEGIANILKKLSLEFPKLGVVFDGVNYIAGETAISKELAVVDEIANLIPKQKISVYNSIGCMTYESVVWAKAIDFYIAPFGSGLTKVTYIANKPGIVHTNHTALNPKVINQWYNGVQRENGIMPTYISRENINDIKGSGKAPIYDSYDLRWEVIYDEAMKIISTQLRK